MILPKRSYSHFDEDKRLCHYLHELGLKEGYVIDIGAGDGKKMSNTYHLFKQGFHGLAIEANPRKYDKLARNYAGFDHVFTALRKIIPENVNEIITDYQVPPNPVILSIDIDGYDYDVLFECLKYINPYIIITEINEIIPPPMKFKVLPSESFQWQGGHFFGYSISCLEDLMTEFDFALAELHYNNVILIKRSLAEGVQITIEEAYNSGYRDRADRKKKFPYNKDVDYLLELSPSRVEEELNRMFDQQEEAYSLKS